MRKLLIATIIVASAWTVILGYGRSGDLAQPTFQNSGDSAAGISITISSESATQIFYTTSTSVVDREILIQNTSADYEIFCGTHSSVANTSGPRMFIPTKGSLTTNGNYDIWCIVEDSGTSTEILGVIEWSSKD